MTRKDYILIAAALKIARDSCSAITQTDYRTMAQGATDTAIESVANALARDNGRFDRSRFLRASGVPSTRTSILHPSVRRALISERTESNDHLLGEAVQAMVEDIAENGTSFEGSLEHYADLFGITQEALRHEWNLRQEDSK